MDLGMLPLLHLGLFFRARTLVALCTLLLVVASFSMLRVAVGDPLSTASLLYLSHKSFGLVDLGSNTPSELGSLTEEAEAIAVSSKGSIWVLSHKRLTRFSPAGVKEIDVDLDSLVKGFGEADLMHVNPYDDTVWVASERTMLHLSFAGALLHSWAAPENIRHFALDIDGTVWVLSKNSLTKLSSTGTVLATLILEGSAIDAQSLVIDSLGGKLWLAGKNTITQRKILDPSNVGTTIALPSTNPGKKGDDNTIEALSVDPLHGVLWVVTKTSVFLYDRAGTLLSNIQLATGGSGEAEAIVFEPIGRSVWIAERRKLLRFGATGEFVAEIPLNEEIEGLAATPFLLQPSVSIVQPGDGALTNNPKPLMQLSLGARCNSVVCDLPSAYTASLLLDVNLDGLAIGNSFQINGADATYRPAGNLTEGLHHLSAQAFDLFGNRSTQDQILFTVDTIPPMFRSVTPADGSVLSNGAVTISGTLDDPTGNVSLFDQGGTLISHGGASFAFAVVLKAGLNVFTLTARDPAGNTNSIPLRLSLGAGISIKITSPTSGASAPSQQTIVKGTFQGPSNTGIAVNNVVAQTQGNTFVANVPLALGGNTVTASAITLDGQAASDSIVVTVNQTSADPISFAASPQSGVAPLKTRFTVGNQTGLNIASIRIDFDGNGTFDFTSTDPNAPIEFFYLTPGTYTAHAEVTDSQNKTYTQDFAIVVHDAASMDQMFTTIWNGMNDALKVGDIDKASSYLTYGAQKKYKPVFTALKPHFTEIVASYSPLTRLAVVGDVAEYVVQRPFNAGQRVYLINFLKDANGVWRLGEM